METRIMYCVVNLWFLKAFFSLDNAKYFIPKGKVKWNFSIPTWPYNRNSIYMIVLL